MTHWPDAPAWQALRAQVQPAVDALCERIPGLDVRPLAVRAGGTNGPLSRRATEEIYLSSDALGPQVIRTRDQWLADQGLPLDRWRRTIAALTEGAVLHALDQRHGPAEDDWQNTLRVGLAADLVDTADPHLGHAWAPAVRVLQSPHLTIHDHPRTALFWVRFAQVSGPSPRPTPDLWHAFAHHCRDPRRGPAATLPVPIAASSPDAFSKHLTMAPLSARVLNCPLRQAGRSWSVDGPGRPLQLDPHDGAHTLLFSSVAGGTLHLRRDDQGPLGRWQLNSGGMGNHFGAARGVSLHMRPDGRATLTAADGFVGPTTRGVLDMADQYGVSGSADGTWRLVSIDTTGRSGRLRIQGLHTGMATVHGRGGGGFALPAEEWLAPTRQFLQMLEAVPLQWTLLENGRQLRLQAPMLNGLELRLSRETA